MATATSNKENRKAAEQAGNEPVAATAEGGSSSSSSSSSGSASTGVQYALKNASRHYDILVVGAGGGSLVASPASRLGLKVAHCEHGFDVFGQHKTGLGGTCLNRGCIPSKMLIHAADVAQEIKHASKFSLSATLHKVDVNELVTRVENFVDSESRSINPMYEKDPNRDWIQNSVYFTGPKKMRISGTDTEITAEIVVLAAGCVPAIPDVPGLAGTPFLTSTEALRLKELPKRLLVLGAGYIAVELGHYFASLGSEVHMLARSQLLRHIDTEARTEFGRMFKHAHVHLAVHLQQVKFDKGVFTVHFMEGGKSHVMDCDQLLVATGVRPVSRELRVEAAGVEVKEGGFLKVDAFLRTTAPGVYAMGDLAGNYLFRHSANYEGQYLAEQVVYPYFEKRELSSLPLLYPPVPWAVFSNPQVAGVGESEDELIARKANYVKGVCPYAKSAMGDAILPEGGFVKVLVERGSRSVLGAIVVGDHASVLIHQIIPVMTMGAKLDHFLNMIHIHPALNEIVRNAFRRARDALVAAGDDLPLILKFR